ncbi:MAG: hypothetical protein K0Q71_6430 [Thermomicrobiales bacterium]|nr:hypothetical protein [Thermomicrobiales bacterium]
MPERQRVFRRAEHAGDEAFLDPVRRGAGHGRQEPGLDRRADDRRRVQRRPAGGRQARCPSEHGVADRGRKTWPARRQNLGHEEGVAAGLLVQG